MPVRIQYEYGEQVGDAIFIHDVILQHTPKRRAKFRCGCGNKFIASIDKVKNFQTRSCGCLHKISVSKSNSTHNLTSHKLYGVWKSMKARCYNGNTAQYKDYGGRGITVCKEWMTDFMNFYTWAITNGWAEGLQLDKDTKGNGMIYCPEGCCFIPPKLNSNNKRSNKIIEYNGEEKTLSQWADQSGVPLKILSQRMIRGWSFEKSIING